MLLSASIEEYLKHLALTKAARTVRTYGAGLEHLLLSLGDVEAEAIDSSVVAPFVTSLHDSGASRTTINVYLVALRRFYRWLLLKGYAEDDLLRFEEWCSTFRQKPKRRAPKLPPEGDVQALLQTIRVSKPDLRDEFLESEYGHKAMLRWHRDLALIELLRGSGCRISEALALTNDDVGIGEALVRGKGDKERTIFWDEEAQRAIESYLELKTGGPDDHLFQRHAWTRNTDAISTNLARNILAEWCRRAHVKPITPHQLRHRFGTVVLKETGNLAAVQDLMGHEDPSTTRIYAKFSNGDLREVRDATSL